MATVSPPPSTTPSSLTTTRIPAYASHIYKPPQSPSSPTGTLSCASSTDYFSYGSRKRPRQNSSYGADNGRSWGTTPSYQQCPTPGDGSYSGVGTSGHGRNSALVNERYRLAGGFDTPSLMATAEMERSRGSLEYDQRRWRGDKPLNGIAFTVSNPVSGPLARERNGFARTQSYTGDGSRTSWTGLAFTLVGKVFNFGTNVFRGFYAGGGKGYTLSHGSAAGDYWKDREDCSTPLPGSWQQEDFLGDFEQDNPQSPAPSSRPPNKRRQTDRDQWVMVGTPDLTSGPSSPKRKTSSLRVDTHDSLSAQQYHMNQRPTASRASSRRSIAPVSRRQSTQTVQSGSPNTHKRQSSTQSVHLLDRRASFAPMRSNSRPSSSSSNPTTNNAVSTAYISPEAERYVKRRVKQDRQADAAMSDMSRKLADLIRQGKEALGTNVEVEGAFDEGLGLDDEGFVDEEW